MSEYIFQSCDTLYRFLNFICTQIDVSHRFFNFICAQIDKKFTIYFKIIK